MAGLAQAALSADQARVIVKLRRSVVLTGEAASASTVGQAERWHQRMRDLGHRAGLSIDESHQIGTMMHVARAHGIASADLARRLALQPDVEYAVVDERRHAFDVAPNDGLYPAGQASPYPLAGQWYLHAPDATLVAAVNAPPAWAYTTGGSQVVVAVIDTGVRYDHVDLHDKLLPGYNMISEAVRAGNAVGRSADASDLGDWLTQSEINANPTVYGNSGCTVESTSSWHGTQVAGIIGASTNNGVGMAGLGWGVRILPVRVLGKCGGYDSDIIAGMNWAAGVPVSGVPDNPNPANVLNLSLGASGTCTQAYVDAISGIVNQQHAVIVAAAGNSEGLAVSVPANCTGVIAVAALRNVGTKVGYSALGPEVVVSAPGGNCVNETSACVYPIVTTTNSGTTTPNVNGSAYTNSSDASLGTSFSTPMVSGVVALMLSAQSSLMPADVRQLLMSTARPFPTTGGTSGISGIRPCTAPSRTTQDECYCTTQTCGAGMLDAGAAVAAAAPSTGPIATVTMTPAQPLVGQAVTFSASSSRPAPSGGSVSQYQWELVDGGGIVSSLNGALQGTSVTAIPSAQGTFSVRLLVTDDQSHTVSSVVTSHVVTTLVTPAAASLSIGSSTNGGGSSGGGGGAADQVLLAMLWLAAALACGERVKNRTAASLFRASMRT